MGEQDRAVHEISDARARMSELATELTRRVDKEHLKEFATEKGAELKERAREFATEKGAEIKEHAREAVMSRTTELKERADSSKGWSTLGAIIGAGVGAVVMRKAFEVREERDEGRLRYGRDEYDERWRYGAYDKRGELRGDELSGESSQGLSMQGDVGFEGRGEERRHSMKEKVSDAKDRAVEMKDHMKDRAHELKQRAMDRMHEHAPNRDELKTRTYEMRTRASSWFERTLDEQPMLLALGGIAVGMLVSSMLPVTRRERRIMEPARHRVEERISEFGDRITEKLRGDSERHADEHGASTRADASMSASSENIGPGNTGISTGGVDTSQENASPTGSRIPPLPPLDDMTKIH